MLPSAVGQEEHLSDPLAKAKAMRGYLAMLLSEHATKSQKAKARQGTIAARRERKTPFHLLRAIDHQLQFVGMGLCSFLPSYPAPGALTRVETRYMVPWSAWPWPVPEPVPKLRIAVKNSATGVKRFEVGVLNMDRPLLSVCHDRESVNLAAMSFLKNHLRLRLATLSDPFHDTWNDIKGAIQASGEWGTVVDLGHCFNLATGPWQSWGFHRQLQSFGQEFLETMDLNNDLYCHLYVGIAEDLGMKDMVGSPEHKARVMEMIPTLPVFSRKDTKVSLSRWLQWFDRYKRFDCQWHTTLLSLCVMGLYMGAYSSYQDLPIWGFGPNDAPAEPPAAEPGSAAASSGAQASQGPVAVLDHKRKLTSAVQLAARILGTPGKQASARRIMTVFKPINTAFAKMQENMRSLPATLNYYIGFSTSKYDFVLRQTWQVLEDQAALDFMGFFPSSANGGEFGGDVSVAFFEHAEQRARQTFALAFHGVKFRSLNTLRFAHTCPSIFVLLLSEKQVVRDLGLARAKRAWVVIDALDAMVHVSPTARKIAKAIAWMDDVFVRETLILLVHHEFQWVPPPVLTMLRAHFHG